jgi:phosphoribosylglycinamide formyltransferase-1
MRFAVLASGDGSTLQALLDAQGEGRLTPAEISLVVCNRPRARALGRARTAGVEAVAVDHREFPERAAFDRRVLAELRARDIDAVVLAGFMRVLGHEFVDAFPGRIINVHPALLPAFPGLHAPRQAIAHGVKVTGCTVHFVEYGVDTGPIIAQACVPVFPDDDEHSLHRRIQVQEHALLCRAVPRLARGALTCSGRVVRDTTSKA